MPAQEIATASPLIPPFGLAVTRFVAVSPFTPLDDNTVKDNALTLTPSLRGRHDRGSPRHGCSQGDTASDVLPCSHGEHFDRLSVQFKRGGYAFTFHRHCEGGTTVAVPAITLRRHSGNDGVNCAAGLSGTPATGAPKATRIVSPVPARVVLLSSSVLQLTPPACGHPL